MLIGEKRSFAIELDVLDIIDDWVFGSFIFWLNDISVGNKNDKTVDLKGCIHWLRDLINNPRHRFEADLYNLDIEQVYSQLCHSVLTSSNSLSVEEKYSDTFSRFHISHIGMSSFDDVTIVLIENGNGFVRCVWQQSNQEINETFLKIADMNKVVKNVITYFDSITSEK